MLFLFSCWLLLSQASDLAPSPREAKRLTRVELDSLLASMPPGLPGPVEPRALPAHPAGALVPLVLADVGTVEVGGDNRGEPIKRWLGALDLPPGLAWCAAYVSAKLDAARAVRPGVRSAWALSFATERSVSRKRYVRAGQAPPVGSLAVYRRRGGGGHVGVVVKSTPKWIETVSGNTSDPTGPRDGVFRKRRSLAPTSRFRPFAFTPVTYER